MFFIKSFLKKYILLALLYISLYLCIMLLITNLFIDLKRYIQIGLHFDYPKLIVLAIKDRRRNVKKTWFNLHYRSLQEIKDLYQLKVFTCLSIM
jgi:hypothetical protein